MTTTTSDNFGWQVFGVVMGLVALFAVLFMFITTYQFKHRATSPADPVVFALSDRLKQLEAYNDQQDEVLNSFTSLTGSIITVQENQQTMLRLVARHNGLLPKAKHRHRVVQQK